MKKTFTILSMSAVLLITASCSKSSDDTSIPVYTIPTTYNFANVDFSASTTRLGMATELSNLLKAVTAAPVDGVKAKAMLSNTGSPFATAAYNTSGINFKDQGAPLWQTDVTSFIDSVVKVGLVPHTTVASRGVAGIGTSNASSTQYGLTASGVNYVQVFNKTLMGGLICYQVVNNYMDGGINSSVNNSTVVTGSGTAMEHNWDLAFGYWGVPIDFPTNKTGVKFWGSYSTQVDSGYHANKILMDAFLKGRAAISNKDDKTKQAQATIILEAFEKLTAAAALQEVKEVKESISDNIVRNSRLSECYGFVYSLKYNPKKKITDAQINTILAMFPANFYDLKLDQLNGIRDAISTIYGFDSVKDIL